MRLTLLISFSLFTFSPGIAAAGCRWSQWSDVATAILQSAPEWATLEKKQDLDRAHRNAAGPGPGPRAALQYLAGAPLAREGEAELRTEWTLERGGKRAARQQLADTRFALSAAGLAGRRAELLRELAITADRLEQIDHEQEILKETVSTYRALIRQLGTQAALAPEQDVTLAVFRLAHDETLLKSGQLQVEEEGFRRQLAYLTVCPDVVLPQDSGKARTVWPEFPDRLQDQGSAWKQQQDAQKAQARAQRDHDLAASQPDLSIGPVARWSLDEGRGSPALGLAASFPLGDAQTKAAQKVAEAAYSLAEGEALWDEKKRAAEYARWLGQYRSAVKVLRQGFAETAVQDKHEKMEQLFLAGRVNASLIIEAHRQMYEHLVSRHQVEWKAVEAYWNLRSMSGLLKEGDL